MLATVLGEAGIGKTRLARELAAHLAGEATVLVGNCLSYGEGITFAPLRELVGQTGAGEGTREELEALLAGEADAERVAEYLSAALSPRGEGVFSAVEIFWAARRLLETLARREPLLVILDDLHWAEPTFLDLVEALAAQAEDAPMLLLCLARPELSGAASGLAGRRTAARLHPAGTARRRRRGHPVGCPGGGAAAGLGTQATARRGRW